MTTPRGSYGGGYGSYYPSSASFPDTPIYDSLVAERGTPQIAPIRVPSPYPSYDTGGYNSYGSGGNLPALPALPALPSGPSAQSQYQQPQQQPVHNGYPAAGYQQQPAPYIAAAARRAAPRLRGRVLGTAPVTPRRPRSRHPPVTRRPVRCRRVRCRPGRCPAATRRSSTRAGTSGSGFPRRSRAAATTRADA